MTHLYRKTLTPRQVRAARKSSVRGAARLDASLCETWTFAPGDVAVRIYPSRLCLAQAPFPEALRACGLGGGWRPLGAEGGAR